MTRLQRLTTLLVAGSLSGALFAERPLLEDARVAVAAQGLRLQRQALGLSADDAFTPRSVRTDELQQTHVRFQQTYKGIRVYGGEVIAHRGRNGDTLAPTSGLKAGIVLNVTPSIERAEALAAAHRDLAPKGPYALEPSAELVVFPVTAQVRARAGADATAFEEEVVRYALAWHVRTDLMNGKEETRSQDYMIDAHTGAILKSWNSLQTGAATGTGNSQWYGTVSLDTNNTGASAYEMRDLTRGNTTVVGAVGNATTNLNHKTSGTGSIYTDTDNVWGDGGMYGSGTTTSTTGATGQTAAVDAHRGLQATWDFYKNVFGRNGIDDTGKATYSRMHYSSSYDNAFWQDNCFCMTYGDGDPANGGSVGEADLDTAGHEMSHGVCANEANLTYSGESGGLNESDSDIFGTMVEFYTLGGGAGSTIPDSASILVGGNVISANYKMFENSWGHAAPNDALRWMYRPDLDGASPNFWYSSLGSLDVHYSSGANNRFFYFLAAGATTSGDTSTAVNTTGSTGVSNPNFLPNGMNGIGNDSAARIWYRALTTYLTSSSTYANARTAALSAATDLFGTNSFEYLSVQNAYHGVNVGAAATLTAVKASISLPSTNQTINNGDMVNFTGSAKDTIPSVSLSYGWDFGDGATASGVAPSHTFSNATGSDVVYIVTFTATDANGKTASATRSVTVHPAGDTSAPVPGVPTVTGQAGTITLAGTATDDVGVTKLEFYVDGALKGSDSSSPFFIAYDSTLLADGSHDLVVKAYDVAGNVGTSSAASFSTDNTAPTGVTVAETGTSGTISFSATASDNTGVQKVLFFIDNVGKATDYTAPYGFSWDSVTKLTDGNHIIVAKAFDAAGNSTSANQLFCISNIPDSTLPVVSNVAVSATSGTVIMSASATDNVAIHKVLFFIDGVGVATDYWAPYQFSWNTNGLSNGIHLLTAKAFDAAGNTSKAYIYFNVAN